MNKIAMTMENMGSRAQLHEYIKRALDFPDHYGHNLDALHDCLTDLCEPTIVQLPAAIGDADSPLGTYGKSVIRVFRSAARANHNLHFELI